MMANFPDSISNEFSMIEGGGSQAQGCETYDFNSLGC